MSTDSNDPLDRLYREVEKLPFEMRAALLNPLNEAKRVEGRRKQIVNIVQETLTQLRLDMKYLIFDLECTRRERDEAKKA